MFDVSLRLANKIPLAAKMENYDYSQKHFIRINKQGAKLLCVCVCAASVREKKPIRAPSIEEPNVGVRCASFDLLHLFEQILSSITINCV